jgi:hypothetical protein
MESFLMSDGTPFTQVKGYDRKTYLEVFENRNPLLAAYYPNVTGGNKGVILEIRRERRVELSCEGLRVKG